jgi:hypothetical protein
MAGRLSLGERHIKDVQAVCRLPAESIGRFRQAVDAADPRPLHPEQIRRLVPESDRDKYDFDPLLRLVLSLISVQRHTDLSPDKILDMIGSTLAEEGGAESVSNREAWEERRPSLKAILADPRFLMVTKALELSYDYMNLLQFTRIITDVRPLYDDATGDQVEGLIITFTLRMIYNSTDGQHSLSIALDKADIDRLEEQCRRARAKANSARERLAIPAGLPALISGSQDDAAL